MQVFSALNKIINNNQSEILMFSTNEFYQKADQYNFSYEEFVVLMGILLNKEIINQTKKELNIEIKTKEQSTVVDFAVFAYIFIGEEFNDVTTRNELVLKLEKNFQSIFLLVFNQLMTSYTKSFRLEHVLGTDNDRANMFAVNAILNLKQGIGFDNFHITLFTVYQSLELKLKQCLKKYVAWEPAALKKQYNFHNLVRLIKLISTTRVVDEQLGRILFDLRQYLRYFEKINPGGQAARYEADISKQYYHESSILIINEKEFLDNYVHALNLLQSLYFKLIEIYQQPTNNYLINKKNSKEVNQTLAALIGTNYNLEENFYDEKLRNILDQQIFGDYQELISLSINDLLTLKFLIRIGFVQYVNNAIEILIQNQN